MVTRDYSVLLDTNILWSKTLRDWIFLLAFESDYRFFQPYVSSGILDEFGYRVRRKKPRLDDGILEKWKQQIQDSARGTISGFLVTDVPGYPDVHDLHVHAAAAHGGMHALITNDAKLLDFAATVEGQENQDYVTLSADDFLMQLTEYAPPALFGDVYLCFERYALNKGYTEFNICHALEEAGAAQFARFLRRTIIIRPEYCP